MGVRDRWNGLGTGGKVLVGLVAGGVVLVVGVVLLLILTAVVGTFVLSGGSSSAGGSVAAPPQMSVATSYDADAGAATLTHDGGDEAQAANLVVRVDGELVDWTDPDGTVSPGDSLTVDASAGSTIRLLWSGGGEDPVTLSSYTVEG